MKSAQLSAISWRSYLRAVLAIAKKDGILFFRYPLNALFRVIEPIAWLTPVYFLGLSFAGSSGNTGFAAYTGTDDFICAGGHCAGELYRGGVLGHGLRTQD